MNRETNNALASELASLVARIHDHDSAYDIGYILGYFSKGSDLVHGLRSGLQAGLHDRIINAHADASNAGLIPDVPIEPDAIFSIALTRINYRNEQWANATGNSNE